MTEFETWVAEWDEFAWLKLCTRHTSVSAQILPDSNGTPRAYWIVRRGRFTARLPLMDCICRETPGELKVCTLLGPLPNNHYGVGHCHAWHPEKVAAYVKYIDKPPRHTPKPPTTIHYRAERDFV